MDIEVFDWENVLSVFPDVEKELEISAFPDNIR
jgi:hypothetical protein